MKRRLFLASAASALAGCGPISAALNENDGVRRVLASAEGLNHALIGTRGLAREYRDRDVDRAVSRQRICDAVGHALRGSRDGRASPRIVSSSTVRSSGRARLASRNSTRCRSGRRSRVTIASRAGARSASGAACRSRAVLDAVRPRDDARYVVFRCMDNDGAGNLYYESLDLHQARHPQALLAMRLNDAPLDPDHGAPLRLRVPTQLGYKSAKWIARIEVVGSFANIYGGRGGYWEDEGYEWYAGI